MSKIQINDNKINDKSLDYELISKVEFCPVFVNAKKPISNLEKAFSYKPIITHKNNTTTNTNFTYDQLKNYITL